VKHQNSVVSTHRVSSCLISLFFFFFFFSKLNVSEFLNVDCLLNDEDALELNDDKVIDQNETKCPYALI
jgi:hypothetical protein